MSGAKSIAKTAVEMADRVLRIYSLFDMGKSLIETYKDKHNSLKVLFIKAFKQAIDDVSKQYTNDSTKSFLKNCREIGDVYDCESLYNYICKINNDMKVQLKDNELENISNKITEQLNCVVLNDNEYKDLYNVFSHYQLNSISFKLGDLDDILQKIKNLINDDKTLGTDNEVFARAYKERLFMHSVGDISISLSDIFVIPDVLFINKNSHSRLSSDSGLRNALKAIRDFVNNKDQHVFFLEGFGGYGKSSIVSYLAYNYLFNRSSPNIDFLDDRQLVIIRLRDIDSNNIINSITAKLNNIGKLSRNAVLIFDGLDELCLIENRSDGTSISESIISEFVKDDKKAIITSRPTYIKYEKLRFAPNINYLQTEIMSFDEEKRQQFVNLFTCKDNRHKAAADYIRTLNIYFNSIYNSPFLLYLIMSGGINEDEKLNSWKLLHRIFYVEMFKPMYNPGVRNLSEKDIDKIYQYNCEIANEMFKTQNQKLSFTYNELEDLLPKYKSDEYVKKSHGLFSYMRYNNGAVEFVHNHIRDFFLCEKVLRTMLEWYENDFSAPKIALELCDLLKYSLFEEQVKLFIKEAFESKKKYNTIHNKCTLEHLPNIFDLFYDAGGIVNYNYFNAVQHQSNASFEDLSSYTIGNASYIYKIIYLNKNVEYINWFSKRVMNSNVVSMMSLNLHKANLYQANLSEANLQNADLTEANLSEANLRIAKLTRAKLSGANLSKADMRMADLTKANLSEANLFMTDLRNVNLKHLNIGKAKARKTKYNNNTKFSKEITPQEPEWFYWW